MDVCTVQIRTSQTFLHRLIHYAAEENPDVPELVRGKSGRVLVI